MGSKCEQTWYWQHHPPSVHWSRKFETCDLRHKHIQAWIWLYCFTFFLLYQYWRYNHRQRDIIQAGEGEVGKTLVTNVQSRYYCGRGGLKLPYFWGPYDYLTIGSLRLPYYWGLTITLLLGVLRLPYYWGSYNYFTIGGLTITLLLEDLQLPYYWWTCNYLNIEDLTITLTAAWPRVTSQFGFMILVHRCSKFNPTGMPVLKKQRKKRIRFPRFFFFKQWYGRRQHFEKVLATYWRLHLRKNISAS